MAFGQEDREWGGRYTNPKRLWADAQGTPVSDAIRSIGVTEVTYYRWRQEYSGLKSDQVKRLKDLEPRMRGCARQSRT